MTIDFYKLIQIITPPALRRTKLLELFRILIAKPMQNLHTDLVLWREVIRYKAALTPQTIALETMAKKLLDTTIEITELDGKPFDFLVLVEGTPDLNKLTRLLNTYKLAGKSFTYVLSGAVYACDFVEHVQEDIPEAYDVKFIWHVPEDDRVVNIRVGLRSIANDDINGHYWCVAAKADRNVASRIEISGVVVNDNGFMDSFFITIESGGNEAFSGQMFYRGDSFPQIKNCEILPKSDAYYNYNLLTWQIQANTDLSL